MNILQMIGYTPNITWAIEKHISSFGFKKFFLHAQKFFNKCGMTCENEVRRSLAVLVYSKFCIQALASKFTYGGGSFFIDEQSEMSFCHSRFRLEVFA